MGARKDAKAWQKTNHFVQQPRPGDEKPRRDERRILAGSLICVWVDAVRLFFADGNCSHIRLNKKVEIEGKENCETETTKCL